MPLLKKKLCKEEKIVELCVCMMHTHEKVPISGGYRPTSCTFLPWLSTLLTDTGCVTKLEVHQLRQTGQ